MNAQEKIIHSYKSKGFIKNKKDEEGLHLFHSPYEVPGSLTKLQVRRRINYYFKHGPKIKLSDLFGNRVEVFVNGKFRLGADFGGKAPDNSKELLKLLKTLLNGMKNDGKTICVKYLDL